jgi:poly-gamma-glutamate synthesis protein (capsule biosynthesis protein)
MNTKYGLTNILGRVLGVALTAAMCIVFGTAYFAPEKPDGAQDYTPLVEATATPDPEPEYFTLSFVGDCTLASSTYNKSLSSSYENTVGDDYEYPFALTKQYFEDDDFTFANLECALTNSTQADTKSFVFRADPDYANILTEGGVEFVTLGNNHVLDYGEQGYADTKAALDMVGISYAGRDEYAVYETKTGLKIGVYAVSFGEESQIKAGIAALKAQNVDFIIAALHWGDEGSYDVNSLQLSQAHAAIDAGADFVYGSHPHTLQPREEYNGGVIYYSMGNWSFGGNTSPRDPDTIILQLTVKRDVDGTVSIDNETVIPCACTGVVGGNNYQPVPYDAGSEEYQRTLTKIDGSFDGPNLTIGYTYTVNELQ